MQIRDDRSTRPFGRRRSPEVPRRPVGLDQGALRDGADRPAGPFGWALRTAAIFGFLAAVGAYQLARLSPSGEAPARIAMDGRQLPADPDTTGAITATGVAKSAGATRLDPCRLRASDDLRP
jgi:hypothetical protein